MNSVLTHFRTKHEHFLIGLALALLVGASSWFLVQPGMPALHDFIHGVRIAEMRSMLSEGQFPPRWSQNFGFGYGMPLFQFYAPLPWMVGAGLYALTNNLLLATKLLFVIANILTVIGGFSLTFQIFKNKYLALLGAALVTLHPYHALNLVVRGAIAESWALGFLLCALAATLAVWQTDTAKRYLYLSLIGLFLSHNLTTFMGVLPIAGLVLALVFSDVLRGNSSNIPHKIFALAGTGFLAVASSAFYLLPSFFENSATQLESRILTGYFDYRVHFLYIRQFFQENWIYGGSGWGPNDTMSFFVGWPVLFGMSSLILVGLVAVFHRKLRVHLHKMCIKHIQELLILVSFLGVGGASLYLSTFHSQWAWEAFSLLKFLQFPWRWLGNASIVLSVVALIPVIIFRGLLRKIVLAVLIIFLLYSLKYSLTPFLSGSQTDLYYDDSELVSVQMSAVLPDYLPQAALISDKLMTPPLEVAECLDNTCQISVLLNQAHQKLLTVSTENQTALIINTFNFPGWQLEVDGKPISHLTYDDGRILARIPQGNHQVGVWYGPTPLRKSADYISAVAILVGAYYYLFGWPGKKYLL